MSKPSDAYYTESIFMDSGAFSLYATNVRKRNQVRIGKHGRALEAPIVAHGQGDFSYYSLKKGSDFRAYCDRYASFMKAMADKDMLIANVDVISNPELTWEVQQFFEQEHGVRPVPVIHAGTSFKWVDRYMKTGNYDLLGIGGMARGVDVVWVDDLFVRLCPKSNGHKPIIKLHGFAVTSWRMICRWPWWSVDSASWIKISAFGWLQMPRWSESKGWQFDKPPMLVSTSSRSPARKERNKHIDNVDKATEATVYRWLKRCGVPEGSVTKDDEMIEWGVRSHGDARAKCNLYYFKDLEESRPAWPYPLDLNRVTAASVDYHRGLGF